MRAAKGALTTKRGGLSAVGGVRAAGVACGLKKTGRSDLALVVSDRPATVAATFTLNRVQAAPVQVSKRHLRGGRFAAIVLNSGNANACTGRQGLRDAEETAAEVARVLGRPVGRGVRGLDGGDRAAAGHERRCERVFERRRES